MSKKILITGASGAFGKLTSLALIKNGYQVVGTMRSITGKNQQVAQELQAAGVQLVEMDVTKDESVQQAVLQTITMLDGLDIVFNNAGIGAFGIQELFSAEDMHKVFDVNVYGVQRVMRAILPHFRKQGRGTVLYTSSLIGRITVPFYGTYCASKWALEALVESYRAELSGFGVESCIIEPGAMPTAFFDAMLQPNDPNRASAYGEFAQVPQLSNAGLAQALEANPQQKPERVAEAVVALLEQGFGKKPFRTTVDFMGVGSAIDSYNAALKTTTENVYKAFGNDSMLALNQ